MASRRQIPAFGEGDQAFGQPPRFLCLRDGRLDAFVLEQRRDEVPQHRTPVGRRAAQLAMIFPVSHVSPIPFRPAAPAV